MTEDGPTMTPGDATAPTPRKRAPRKAAAAATKPAKPAKATTPGEDRESAAPRKRTRKAAADAVAAPETSQPPAAARKRTRSAAKAAAPAAAASDPTLTSGAADAPVRKGSARRPAGPPAVTFQPPVVSELPARPRSAPAAPEAAPADAESAPRAPRRRSPRISIEGGEPAASATEPSATSEATDRDADGEADGETRTGSRRRRGRRGRGRGKGPRAEGGDERPDDDGDADDAAAATQPAEGTEGEETDSEGRPTRRRRKRSRTGGAEPAPDDPERTVVRVREPRQRSAESEVQGIKGSTRLEAKRQRRRDGRDQGRRRPAVVTEAEFLARREAVERVMLVRQHDDRTQIAVLEDDVLVEHYVTKASATSYAGNVYLGKVQNVLPSMEAAFVDIGKGRNAVLYAGEVNYDASALEGRAPRIEQALKSGQSIVVQVTKDPMGQKGARLTSQISLPGRYMVFVPQQSMTGISRKLPDTERARLKGLLKILKPEDAGIIIRTAAEGASEEELTADLDRLKAQWDAIEKKTKKESSPALLYAEPDLVIKVIRDNFNEDFSALYVEAADDFETIRDYLEHVAPDLLPRLSRYEGSAGLFEDHRVTEQIAKALERKVGLPSGGSLVIDRTEAMTVVDVNTGKFTGKGGNLEETVTKNNLEAAEEIVRQLRLRDIGGIIVVDFIDMILEANRELVARRLKECLGRDRTKHQVAEITSLGLLQMTRKRISQGLLESFSEPCPDCNGRGVVVTLEAPEKATGRRKRGGGVPSPAALAAMAARPDVEPEPAEAADAADTVLDVDGSTSDHEESVPVMAAD